MNIIRNTNAQKTAAGYFLTLVTILIWGMTFISTKILLDLFSPAEILFIRFFTAWICLTAVSPRPFKTARWTDELWFAGAGLSGVTMYQLLENIALSYSYASNVGVIVSIAPFFTGIAMYLFLPSKTGRKKPGFRFFAGFAASITGIALISFSGAVELKINPVGDFLALTAALCWAVYSVCIAKINEQNLPIIAATRHIFFYALLFMIPVLIISGINSDVSSNLLRFTNPAALGHLAFLGIGASALCFATWNAATRFLGVEKITVYIYLIPVITMIGAGVILGEKVTPVQITGAALTIAGLLISEEKKS